jgi:hypothetical protein
LDFLVRPQGNPQNSANLKISTEVLLMASFVPFFYFDFKQIDDMSELFDSEELARQPYKTDKYQEMVKKEFPKLVAEGFLDL